VGEHVEAPAYSSPADAAVHSREGHGRKGMLMFEASLTQPVEGRLLKRGELLMLDGQEQQMKRWTILLFSNGFYTVPQGCDGGELQSFAWSPFSEVRELNPDPEEQPTVWGTLPAFTLYLFSQSLGFVFAPYADGAAAERRRWVAAMASTLQAFTRSLFPPFSLSARPLSHVPSTSTRLLAGYLLREETDGVVAAPYCELHAQKGGSAIFAMYENECCERLESSLSIKVATAILDRDRSQCSCFSLDGVHFCARSFHEKHLWLRALRNVKVKIINKAPDPTEEDLQHWRAAVTEATAGVAAASELEASRFNGGPAAAGGSVLAGRGAVGRRGPGRPPATPFGAGRRAASSPGGVASGASNSAVGTHAASRSSRSSSSGLRPGGRRALQIADAPLTQQLPLTASQPPEAVGDAAQADVSGEPEDVGSPSRWGQLPPSSSVSTGSSPPWRHEPLSVAAGTAAEERGPEMVPEAPDAISSGSSSSSSSGSSHWVMQSSIARCGPAVTLLSRRLRRKSMAVGVARPSTGGAEAVTLTDFSSARIGPQSGVRRKNIFAARRRCGVAP